MLREMRFFTGAKTTKWRAGCITPKLLHRPLNEDQVRQAVEEMPPPQVPAGFPHPSPSGEDAGAIPVFEAGPTRQRAAGAVFNQA
jgi:hypothetical protein